MTGQPLELDLRAMPCEARHPIIFAAWEELNPGAFFTITNDHDPVPLRLQLTRRGGNTLKWDYLERGPGIFRVRIEKLVD